MLAIHILTHTFEHIFLSVKIHMDRTKSSGTHINLVGLMWILTKKLYNYKNCIIDNIFNRKNYLRFNIFA